MHYELNVPKFSFNPVKCGLPLRTEVVEVGGNMAISGSGFVINAKFQCAIFFSADHQINKR